MPTGCCIVDCKNYASKELEIKVYMFPQPWKRYPKMDQLAKERQARWLTAINRPNLNTKTARVCSRHFISGKSAHLRDHLNPDWVPNLHLEYGRSGLKLPLKSNRLEQNAKSKSLEESQATFKELVETVAWTRTLRLKKLSELRQKRWGKAINKKSLNTKIARVCSKHFISGKPAKLLECFNPDWVPSLHLRQSIAIVKAANDSSITTPRSPSNSWTSEVTNDEEEFLEEYLDEAVQSPEDIKPPQEQPLNAQETGIHCCVPNCENVRNKQHSKTKFFRFPNSKLNSNSERLYAWINAIKRIDITHLNAPYKLICSDHFKSGAPANSNDKSNPDWIPNLKLPTTLTTAIKRSSSPNIMNNFDTCDSDNGTLDPLAGEDTQMTDVSFESKILPDMEIRNSNEEIQQLKHENEMLKKQLNAKDLIIESQKKKLLELIQNHKLEQQEKQTTIHMLETTNLKISLSRDGFKNDDKKVHYLTGLPSFAALDIIYNYLEEYLVGSLLRRINKFDAFILVLIKLRLDLPLAYLGYRYGIAGNTTATIFHTNLKMLSEKLAPFIRWPEKTAIRETPNTSLYFKRVLGNKFTALLDFIEDPGPNVSQEYILQRKYIKRKYLVAISPAGGIAFVSKGYDTSLSVKEIAESCGVLDYTDDGDIILSDYGAITHQVFTFNGCKVLVESTRNTETDLLDTLLQNTADASTNVETDEVDSCRVHLQRSLSNLKNKFFILTNKYKIGIIKTYKDNEGGECYFDYVLRVCCALTNVSPAILSFETKKS